MTRFEHALWNRACAVLGADDASALITAQRRFDEATNPCDERVWLDRYSALMLRVEAAEEAAAARAAAPVRVGEARAHELHRLIGRVQRFGLVPEQHRRADHSLLLLPVVGRFVAHLSDLTEQEYAAAEAWAVGLLYAEFAEVA